MSVWFVGHVCGGKRSVVSGSAWRDVGIRGSAAMAEHCPPAICVEGNALSFPGLRGACRYRRFSGNGRALPSSDLCGGKRSVVSASARRCDLVVPK